MARNIGRSISAVRTLCTIIPFDPEAERKINSGEENRFGAADMFEIISSRWLDRFVSRRFREVKQT
ncbi:hypothetical protein NYE69_17120 [Paenibacillus sp. FSL R5-0527]|uniref:hypothetical protein n=1 Tax=Paenibacillus sp. FSL R5-0527 TaxID=2975321 RepID=UPI0030F7243F